MRPRSINPLLLIGMLLVPIFALAADAFEDVSSDAALLEEVLRQDTADQQAESAEAAREGGDELFPDIPTEEESVEDDTGPFVTLRYNGFPVVLKDVPRTAWFAPYVRDVASRGIVSGYKDANGFPTGEFGPANNVTVAELAKMAIEAAGINEDDCPDSILNATASGAWSHAYIACAEQGQWAIYGDGSVDVQRSATRSEVVVTILQAFDVPVRELTGSGTAFSDVGAAIQFAGAIQTAAQDGLISGYADAAGNPTGIFGPADPVKRAEIAKMISLALQLYAQ